MSKWKTKWWVWSLLTVCLLVLAVAGTFFYRVWGTIDQSYESLNRTKSDKRENAVTIHEPFTIMMVGTDVRDEEKEESWRSDVLLLAAVNPEEKTIQTVSIPRDTLAEIQHAPVKTKINAAPYYGSQSRVGAMTNTVQTVEHFLNVPIDYYVKVNFNGFMDMVDAVGGVDVNVPFDFSFRLFYQIQHFKKGPAHLDGKQALGYVRMRKSDPQGDLGRNIRQREVVQALMNKITSFQSITKINDLLNAVGKNVTHSFQLEQLTALPSLYSDIKKENIQTLQLKGVNSNHNPQKTWFYLVSDEERLRISRLLRKQLNLPPQTLDGKLLVPHPEI